MAYLLTVFIMKMIDVKMRRRNPAILNKHLGTTIPN